MNKTDKETIDQNKYFSDDLINIRELFNVLWHGKFLLVLFVFLSIPFSVYTIMNSTPKFVAEVVIQNSKTYEKSGPSSLSGILSSGLIGSVSGMQAEPVENRHISRLLSKEFLKTVIFGNKKLETMVKKYCSASSGTGSFSLSAIIPRSGEEVFSSANDLQRNEALLICIRRMLSIGKFSHRSVKTSAVMIIAETPNALFSSMLANELAEKFFLWESKEKEVRYQRTRKYLYDKISEAQLGLNNAQQKLREFSIKNANLVSNDISFIPKAISDNPISVFFQETPFGKKIREKIVSLGQTESYEKEHRRVLDAITKLDITVADELRNFIDSKGIEAVLSRNFISDVSKIYSSDITDDEKVKVLSPKIDLEIARLKSQIIAFENDKNEREFQTKELMEIEKKFKTLELNVVRQATIFESLKDQLNSKIFEAGIASLDGYELLSKAVTPLTSSNISKKVILASGAFLGFVLGIAFLLIRQNFKKTIFSLKQLDRYKILENKFEVSLKHARNIGDQDKDLPFGRRFLSQLFDIGRTGCIIDLSTGRLCSQTASRDIGLYIGKLITKKGDRLLCVNGGLRQNSKAYAIGNKKPTLNSDAFDIKEDSNLASSEDNGQIEKGMLPLGPEFGKFDKVILTLTANMSDFVKFDVIEKSDFYLLIGQSGKFNLETFKKFIENIKGNDKKCLGFILTR